MDELGKNEKLTEIVYSIIYQYNCDRGITVKLELSESIKKHQEEREGRNHLREERKEKNLRRWRRMKEWETEREMRKKLSNV